MLCLIGLGIWDEADVPMKAIEAIKECQEVYCEMYTANWRGDLKKLQKLAGRKITVLPREMVESDFLVKRAKKKKVALLVPGDPLVATTHFQLIYDARKEKIKTGIIHASSIYTAVAETGLSIYKFGRTTTLAYAEKGYEPTSPYEVILLNRKLGLHTLLLLDTKNSGMKISEALEILAQLDKENAIKKVVAVAKIGSREQLIKYGNAEGMKIEEHGAIVIPGILNYNEEEALKLWE